MRKSFYLIPILTIGLISNTFGQDPLELTFTAQNNGLHVPLDSISITNLTQGGDTILYAPDTVLLLGFVGISQHNLIRVNDFSVSQNYPHPFIGQTFIDVCMVKTDNIEICILDILGREQESYEGVLEAGKHTFTFHPGNEYFYIFSVSCCGQTKSMKIVNPLPGKQDCKLTYKAYEKQANLFKSALDSKFPFSLGDQLRYIGYSKTTLWIRGSDVIEDIPETYELYIFDITEGIPCEGIPTVVYQFRSYNTVQIGDQCWMKENLNTGIMINGSQLSQNNGIIEKYCYNNIEDSCTIYGGLYLWDEMMEYSTIQGVQGICPQGWHISTDAEWKILEGTVDSQYGVGDPEWENTNWRGFDAGQNLRSISGWEPVSTGRNLYGFTALPSGYMGSGGNFYEVANLGNFWTSTQNGTSQGWFRYLVDDQDYNGIYRGLSLKEYSYPVRCIKD